MNRRDLVPPWGDHNRYPWQSLFDRPRVSWPRGALLAVWVVVPVETFRFDAVAQPFTPDGAPTLNYPDFWGHSQRDYGNRVGFYRLARMLERLGVRATAAVNSDACSKHPHLLGEVERLGWEVIGHGVSASEPVHDGLTEHDERTLLERALRDLRAATGQPVTGWLSPSGSESTRTLDLLAELGIDYVCDWPSDDLPFWLRARTRDLVALPCSAELDDRAVMIDTHQSADEFEVQVAEQANWLVREAREHGGRTMSVVLHPWISGVPHRIRAVERALAGVITRDVWVATGGEIVREWQQAQARAGTTARDSSEPGKGASR